MKTFLILLGAGAAGVLGYLAEPQLREQITGTALAGRESAAETKTTDVPPDENAIDPASLTEDQLPEKVILKADVKFSDPSSGLSLTVTAGNLVKLLRIENTKAIVRPGDTAYSLAIPIDQTNLMEWLSANPPKDPEPEPAPEPAPDMAPEPEPAPEPAPAPAPEVAPAPAPEVAPEPEPEVAPPPAPEPAPEPEPEVAPAPVPAVTGATDVVSIMQASIRAGQIKEFTSDQVLGWKAEADETIDGEVFKAGSVSYKAETIFGIKTIQAKALIKEGKVQRWIWPKSGMEIQ